MVVASSAALVTCRTFAVANLSDAQAAWGHVARGVSGCASKWETCRVRCGRQAGGKDKAGKVREESAEPPEKQAQQQREAVAALRRRHRIHASPGTPDPMESFDSMQHRSGLYRRLPISGSLYCPSQVRHVFLDRPLQLSGEFRPGSSET